MKTIKFTNRPYDYGCSKSGDNSGEYVRADVARELVAACKAWLELESPCPDSALRARLRQRAKELSITAISKAEEQA